MQNEKIIVTRIRRLLERQRQLVHPDRLELGAEYCYNELEPITYGKWGEFKPIRVGGLWGQPWGSAWFRVKVAVPASFSGKMIGLWFDCDGEACVWQDGTPWQGLTPKVDWYHNAAKYYVPLSASAQPGDSYELLIEAAANDLFGGGETEYKLRECALVSFDETLWQALLDIEVLLNLTEALPERTVRRQRILYGLNRVCDLWNSRREDAFAILKELLSQTAHASALTAYSVGQAHLDLAWLWPIRESKRKGGRTFTNALRLLEAYPDYIFGASQAQLYQWMKDLYPSLYEQVKQRIKEGRWEVQGAHWVEFDTNLISGESIIRQFLYGKRFFAEEFGVRTHVLWLPDCFGFSGNLPQYLAGCGVDWFVTQKLSWNETNTFPHHLFLWEGIDGTRIKAHQLPTNDYHFSNTPSAFQETEKRYAQSEVCDAFLNLYGIGDGGGGPTRNHLEYGLRQRDLEGVARFRFSHAEDFFEHLKDFDFSQVPVAYGELYLEYHRGTYTTQARMKQDNRASERLLQQAEFIAALTPGNGYPEVLRRVWEDVLLLQFHDIIPGSSITKVYEDAHTLSEANHHKLEKFISSGLEKFTDSAGNEVENRSYIVFNPSNWERKVWHLFTFELKALIPFTGEGAELPSYETDEGIMVQLTVPPWGYSTVVFRNMGRLFEDKVIPAICSFENKYLKVSVTERGSISSILDKRSGREVLKGESNLLKLWEDEPNNWGAWDINHFYRGIEPSLPGTCSLVKEESYMVEGRYSRITHDLMIGGSPLRQAIELHEGEPFIRISHDLDWKEHHKMLRVHFSPDVHNGTATYGIQGGVVKRSAKPLNAWEEAQFEVPAQRFADLSQADRGCALICDCKYGYRVRDGEMELNLLRSPADVDPTADIHRHCYSYAFYPHQGDYEHSDAFGVADAFGSRLLVQPTAKLPDPPAASFFTLESDHVTLDTVKPAEQGGGIILRMHEYKGQSGIARLACHDIWKTAALCNLLEEALQPLAAPSGWDNGLELEFRPFEIKTILLREES
jgi:alpha-mannosidase